MRSLKMIGLAGLIVGTILAFSGPGTAAATGVLCSTATNPCTSKWAVGTAIDFSLKSGTSYKLTDTAANTIGTCTASTIKGKLTSNPAASGSAEGKNEEFTWSGCTVTSDTIQAGGLKIESAGSGVGKVFANATIEVTTVVFGTSCNFGFVAGTALGTITEGTGSAAVFKSNGVPKKLAGSFICPETENFSAEYVLTTPSSTTLYVSSS